MNRGKEGTKRAINKIEHEGIITYARIEISQDADNGDQKVKSFLKVDKAYKLLWKAYFQFYFFPSFYFLFRFTFYKFCDFHPPENESYNAEIDLKNSLLHHFDAFSTVLPSFRFLSVIA